MFSASSSSSELEIADDASVEYAALAYERVRREHAQQRYLKIREEYEVACIARERLRLVVQSHNHTLRLLQGVVGELKAIVDLTLGDGFSVRESTVTAAEMLLASSCAERAECRLVTLLGHEQRQREVVRAAASPATGPSWVSPGLLSDSQAQVPVSSPSQTNMLRPLLLFYELRLDYATLLGRERLPLFSKLACAQRLMSNSSESATIACERADPPSASIVQQYRVQVEDARAALAQARSYQPLLKYRLHELNRMLNRSVPVHIGIGVYVDAVVAEEIRAQLRRELAVGCLTLLRILCENGRDAFDHRGRLRAL
ncbi:hypothetical protein, unknown function [Leishmania tarentolae]|uniref:Uncharacterized protein n=1 Tax=Leishmania tarentolae TaxID=5689 RepID=A0A640KQF3_LEITA|nr:hypothetical protein, unknown function [Leishmania tarentolae]